MRRRLALGPAIALFAALVAGCAGGGTGPAAQNDERPADSAAEIAVAQFSAPGTFDPHRMRNPNGDPGYLSPVYDQLLRLGPDLTIQPMLASDWRMGPDGTSITLTLRDDVRFQDGSGFDSGVVKANLERAKSLPDSTAAPLLSAVSAVETPDPRTVVVRFAQANQTFPYTLAANLNLGSMISGRAIAAGTDLTRAPAGSGPFRLVDLAQDRAVYERDDAYWDVAGRPQLRRVSILGMADDNARLAALQSGQIQLAPILPNQAAAYQSLLDDGSLTQIQFTGEVQGLYLNTKNPALADPRVRQALDKAVDRNAINAALFEGRARPAFQFYPDGMPGFVPDADKDRFDPEGAKRLLAEAGQQNLQLGVILTSTDPGDSIATIVQSQLAAVGVTLNLRKYAPIEARPAWRQGGSDGFTAIFTMGGDPSEFLRRAVLGPDDPGGPPADLAAASATALNVPLTDPARASAFEEITTMLTAQPLHIPVIRVPVQYLARPDLMHLQDMALSRITNGLMDVRPLAVAQAGA